MGDFRRQDRHRHGLRQRHRAGDSDAVRRAGASVVVADRDADSAQQVAGSLENALAVTADVSVAADVQALMVAAEERFGGIDVLVNNAGYGFRGTVVSIDEADWDKLMAVNLKGVFLCSKYAMPALAKAHGSIVNIASYTASVAIADRAAYVASKGAIAALTRAMAIDHIGDGVRVNAGRAWHRQLAVLRQDAGRLPRSGCAACGARRPCAGGSHGRAGGDRRGRGLAGVEPCPIRGRIRADRRRRHHDLGSLTTKNCPTG